MLELFWTENDGVYGKLNKILSRYLPSPANILRTENGKPYIEGDPLFFSISHSGDKAVIVICDKPAGVDLEILKGRRHSAVFSRFPEAERAEIVTERDFLMHWTVREAYIKMIGSTLAEKLNKLSYYGNTIYDGEKSVDCEIINGCNADCVYSICTAK